MIQHWDHLLGNHLLKCFGRNSEISFVIFLLNLLTHCLVYYLENYLKLVTNLDEETSNHRHSQCNLSKDILECSMNDLKAMVGRHHWGESCKLD